MDLKKISDEDLWERLLGMVQDQKYPKTLKKLAE
jgi:hypothetical protein